MPYTYKKTSNTIEDKNTIKFRTSIVVLNTKHQDKTRQDKTLTVRVCYLFLVNKNDPKKIIITCITPLDPYQKVSVRIRICSHH